MEVTRHRAWLAAGTVALLLAGGPVAATAQSTGQPAPEWQQYDQLDDRFGALAWLTFGEVIGSEVVDEQGTRVGSIVGLVRAKSDGMFHAVIDSREPAGAGDHGTGRAPRGGRDSKESPADRDGRRGHDRLRRRRLRGRGAERRDQDRRLEVAGRARGPRPCVGPRRSGSCSLTFRPALRARKDGGRDRVRAPLDRRRAICSSSPPSTRPTGGAKLSNNMVLFEAGAALAEALAIGPAAGSRPRPSSPP